MTPPGVLGKGQGWQQTENTSGDASQPWPPRKQLQPSGPTWQVHRWGLSQQTGRVSVPRVRSPDTGIGGDVLPLKAGGEFFLASFQFLVAPGGPRLTDTSLPPSIFSSFSLCVGLCVLSPLS